MKIDAYLKTMGRPENRNSLFHSLQNVSQTLNSQNAQKGADMGREGVGGDGAAYRVSLSETGKRLSETEFRQGQKEEETRFSKEQERAEAAFEQRQAREKAAFQRGQQQDRVAFQRQSALTSTEKRSPDEG